MAGQDDCIVRQHEQFLMDRLLELFKVSIGKVRPADAPLEQHVAAKDHPGIMFFPDEYDVAGRVPRRVEDVEREAGGLVAIGLVDMSISWWAGDGQTVFPGQVGIGVAQLVIVPGANDERTMGPAILDDSITSDRDGDRTSIKTLPKQNCPARRFTRA